MTFTSGMGERVAKKICGKEGPPHWIPKPVCVLPKGHKIVSFYTKKLRKRRVIKGHTTDSGRMWPLGEFHLEYE